MFRYPTKNCFVILAKQSAGFTFLCHLIIVCINPICRQRCLLEIEVNREEVVALFTDYWTQAAEKADTVELLNDIMAIINK